LAANQLTDTNKGKQYKTHN